MELSGQPDHQLAPMLTASNKSAGCSRQLQFTEYSSRRVRIGLLRPASAFPWCTCIYARQSPAGCPNTGSSACWQHGQAFRPLRLCDPARRPYRRHRTCNQLNAGVVTGPELRPVARGASGRVRMDGQPSPPVYRRRHYYRCA